MLLSGTIERNDKMLFTLEGNEEKENSLEDAVNEIIEKNYNSILNYCRYHLNDSAAATECTQEVFLLYIEKLKNIEIQYPRAWLYRAADNLLNRYRRSAAKEKRILMPLLDSVDTEDSESGNGLVYEQNLEQVLYEKMDIDSSVKKILSQLEPDELSLYNLHFKEGRTLKELAQIYNTTTSAIKNRLYRLKLHIKKISEKMIDEAEKLEYRSHV